MNHEPCQCLCLTVSLILDFCKNNPSAWHVARDIAGKVGEFGSISEKQVAVLEREYDKFINPPAKEEIVDAPSGKQVITGEIISTKFVDNFFGGAIKMLVRDDRGFKVYGTRPASLDGASRGSRVTFSATLEVSKDDPSFAFFSRPTKGVVLPSTDQSDDSEVEVTL